jgi:hypothetical protein
MKEIPILFSAPMVQSILEGRKTMTRRIAAVPVGDHNGIDIMDWGLSKHPYQNDGKWLYTVQTDVDDSHTFELKDKYGKLGDILWVRENWFPAAINGNKVLIGVDKNDPNKTWEIETSDPTPYWKKLSRGCMIPSIHMPKEAARIWLQVTDVRVERLQDISGEDVLAEGVGEKHRSGAKSMTTTGIDYRHWVANQKLRFQLLWSRINGLESWGANPWVWVISFKILSTTGKPTYP